MIIETRPIVVDPLLLLLTNEDGRFAPHPFEDWYLAAALNRELEKELSAAGPFCDLRFIHPADNHETLRWSLVWQRWDGPFERYIVTEDVNTVTALRKGLPKDVLDAIHRLSRKRVEVTHPDAVYHDKKGK